MVKMDTSRSYSRYEAAPPLTSSNLTNSPGRWSSRACYPRVTLEAPFTPVKVSSFTPDVDWHSESTALTV